MPQLCSAAGSLARASASAATRRNAPCTSEDKSWLGFVLTLNCDNHALLSGALAAP